MLLADQLVELEQTRKYLELYLCSDQVLMVPTGAANYNSPLTQSRLLSSLARQPMSTLLQILQFYSLSAESPGLTSFILRFGEGITEVTTLQLIRPGLTVGVSYFLAGPVP